MVEAGFNNTESQKQLQFAQVNYSFKSALVLGIARQDAY
jgi:hypothetical protein